MCGRFALNVTEATLKSHFNLTQGLVIHPRYNIAPSLSIPIIKAPGLLDFARWGFVPAWHKSPPTAEDKGHINARLESILDKPTFKTAFQKNRCLIPATGYFEWREFNAKKHPYYVSLTEQPLFAFAGIWSSWDTCAILTMEAPPFLKALHERVPVIIAPDYYTHWLTSPKLTTLSQYVMPLTEEKMRIYAVSAKMNHPRFDDLMCIRPL